MQPEQTIKQENDVILQNLKGEPVSPPSVLSCATPKTDISNTRIILSATKPPDLPIERNGKIYYPLIFPCENCGIRFSCENTLRAHAAHYCTHRLSTPEGIPPPRLFSVRKYKRRQSELSSPPTKAMLVNESKETFLQLIKDHADDLLSNRCYRLGNILYVAFKVPDPLSVESCVPLDLSNKKNDDERGPLDLSLKELRCSVCGYKGSTPRGMKLHSKLHEAKTTDRLTCEYCQAVFFSRARYTRHISSHDTERKSCIKRTQPPSFLCHYCGVEFSSPSTLNQHLTNYCTERLQPETFCTTCSINFRQKSSYTAHKLYYCPSRNSTETSS